MIEFKQDYTTPEQATRLLGLGLPAWTADMYYVRPFGNLIYHKTPWTVEAGEIYRTHNDGTSTTTPCWSASRLSQIFVYLRGYDDGLMSVDGRDPIDYIMTLFCQHRDEKHKLDYSKLKFTKEDVDYLRNKPKINSMLVEEGKYE